MNLLETFAIRFVTNADEAEKGMDTAEASANRLNDAMQSAAAATKNAAAAAADLGAAQNEAGQDALALAQSTAAIRDKILKDAEEIAEAERNLTQFLLGNEAIHERTLDLLGGQEGLTERIENETKAVAQGLIKAEREAAKLTDELADADREAKELDRSIFGIAKSLAGPVLGLLSAGAALGALKGRVEAVSNVIERASKARFDVASYDQWRRAIIAAGGSAEVVESQFEAFAQKMGEAFGDAESDAAKALKELGVNARTASGEIKPTEDALLDLADAMAGVSRETAVNNLRRMGIVDPLVVDMIIKGRTEVERMLDVQRKSGAMTEAQAEKFKQFRTTLNNTTTAWTGLVDTLLSAVLPAATAVFQAIGKGIQWMTENKTLVQGFGIALAAAMTAAAVVAATVYGPAMAAAAVATIAATWPILAIIAAVAALAAAFALAYEDVQAFLKGQPSLLGELVNKYEWVRKAVEWLGEAFKVAAKWGGEAWDLLMKGAEMVAPIIAALLRQVVRNFLGLADAAKAVWKVAGPILSVIGEAIKLVGAVAFQTARFLYNAFSLAFGDVLAKAAPTFERIGAIVQGFQNVFANVATVLRSVWGAFFGWFVDKLSAAANIAKTVMSMGRNAVNNAGDAAARDMQNARRQMNAADRAPTNATTQTAASNRRPADRRTDVQIANVNVNTQATDARGIAKAVGPALSSEVARANQDNDDGISH